MRRGQAAESGEERDGAIIARNFKPSCRRVKTGGNSPVVADASPQSVDSTDTGRSEIFRPSLGMCLWPLVGCKKFLRRSARFTVRAFLVPGQIARNQLVENTRADIHSARAVRPAWWGGFGGFIESRQCGRLQPSQMARFHGDGFSNANIQV